MVFTPGEALKSLGAYLSHLLNVRGEWLPVFYGSAGSWGKLSVVGSQPPLFKETKEAVTTHTGLNSQQSQSRREETWGVGGYSALMGPQAGGQRLGVTIQGEMNTTLLWCMSWASSGGVGRI